MFALLLVLLPQTAAVGNQATVTVASPDSAAAGCQLLVLVQALIILEVEDGLGLVALPPLRTLPDVIRSSNVGVSSASCRTVIDEAVIHVPRGTNVDEVPTFVSGPPVLPAITAIATGPGSDADVCAYTLLFGSIVIGGGAYGLPTGETFGPLIVETGPDIAGSATCRAEIADLSFVEDL